jgi:hypothetical protein
MSYVITTPEVLEGFQTGASTADVAGFIAVVDQADNCLARNSVSDVVGRQMKILAVRHLLSNSSDRGAVTQERAVSGASRSYKERVAGETGFLETLRTIDTYGCVMSTINKNQRIQLRSVGRRAP